jgi:CIC family chloride channel protein
LQTWRAAAIANVARGHHHGAVASPRPARTGLLAALLPEASPLDLRILGRTLLHAALVGAAAGLVGAAFFAGLELVQRVLLELICGYRPLRALGEHFLPEPPTVPFRPWLLVLLPGAGALLGGILTSKVAPEAQGGGGDATIEAFHHHGGQIRKRVIWVKAVASVLTLGSGGSGGREGPTMQIGGALGSLVGRLLGTSVRERQVLLVAGVAAGMAAVFRTPLGAALLAAEVMYRDDFESDALIPGVLASVVAYAIVISIYGESTLFAHAAHYPFVPAHLPLYGLLAVLIALFASGFLALLRFVQRTSQRLPGPAWLRPGLGGLVLGIVAVPAVLYVGHVVGQPGQGLGLLGGGYGAAQIAIVGGDLLPQVSWRAVEILLLLAAAKAITASLTIGSGGSAGDFAPSLVLGALFGGAFGRMLALLLHDPRIDPGAFALVGMGTFYGGIAHVPLSALVMVCELAGSYDLLVPLMLAEGIVFVALRNRSLYPAQRASRQERSPDLALDALAGVKVKAIMTTGRAYASFAPGTPATEVMRRVSDLPWQDVFPVLDKNDAIVGVITSEGLRILAGERALEDMAIAADVMQPPTLAKVEDDARTATQVLLKNGLAEIPIVDDGGKIVGFLGESEIAQAYLRATAGA